LGLFSTAQDYSKQNVRPDRFAKKNTKHVLSEYLTPIQKKMKAQRDGPITKSNGFDNSWSGYDRNIGAIAVSRRLRSYQNTNGNDSIQSVAGVCALFALMSGLVVGTVFYHLGKPLSEEEIEEVA
jgi:hypothetical protein